MGLTHISLVAACLAYCSKVRVSHIFQHKLAFSTAVSALFVFLLPISIRFRYLDHLAANRMAPSTCPDPCATRWGSWFRAISCHTSAYFCRMFGVYAVRIFFKCCRKVTCRPSYGQSIPIRDSNRFDSLLMRIDSNRFVL